MKANSPAAEIERISTEIHNYGITPEISIGQHKTIIGLIDD
ncbi:MAG: hypothetical protein V7L25_12995 [Nostoc sp.]